jgi:hypothetical protein
MVKKVAITAGIVVATLVVLHFVAPAAVKAYTGTT